VPRYIAETSYSLPNKEITHRSDLYRHGYVWTPRRTFYRYEKRRMAKMVRQDAKQELAFEYDGSDLELVAQLELWVTYLRWIEERWYQLNWRDYTECDCYCRICHPELWED
jgi:hypothetical protein